MQQLLYERFAPEMKGVCLRYARTSFEAEDLMHDGFVKVFRHIESFKGNGSLEGWIRRIMVNTAISHHRQNLHKTESMETEMLEMAGAEPATDHFSANDLLEMVLSLPEKYRLVFNLFAIEGYSHKEAAEMLEITEVAARTQYMRARQMLKIMVNQETKTYHEKISG